jgi:hypothetical protein
VGESIEYIHVVIRLSLVCLVLARLFAVFCKEVFGTNGPVLGPGPFVLFLQKVVRIGLNLQTGHKWPVCVARLFIVRIGLRVLQYSKQRFCRIYTIVSPLHSSTTVSVGEYGSSPDVQQ